MALNHREESKKGENHLSLAGRLFTVDISMHFEVHIYLISNAKEVVI